MTSPMNPEITAAASEHDDHEVGELVGEHPPRAALLPFLDRVRAVAREPARGLGARQPGRDVGRELGRDLGGGQAVPGGRGRLRRGDGGLFVLGAFHDLGGR